MKKPHRWILFILGFALAANVGHGQYLITGPVVVQGGINYFVSATGSDAYAGDLPRTLGTYPPGVCFLMRADVANTGACTVDVDGTGTRDLRHVGGAVLATGTIQANGLALFCYNEPSGYMEVLFSTSGGGGTTDAVLGYSVLTTDNKLTKVSNVDGTLSESQVVDNGTAVGVGGAPTVSGTGKLHALGNTARPFDTARTPTSSTMTCNEGELLYDDAGNLYLCKPANNLKRFLALEF